MLRAQVKAIRLRLEMECKRLQAILEREDDRETPDEDAVGALGEAIDALHTAMDALAETMI